MSEDKNLSIPFGRVWRIVADESTFVLQRRSANRWTSVYYPTSIQHAVDLAFGVAVRTSGAQSAEALAQRIEEIREEFRQDLLPFFTAPRI